MLLGIGLHAAIPFVPWRGEGDTSGWLLDVFVAFVHGFRMPLFFVISGFFTAMLWRRRGLRSLIRHRLRRVGLPLLVGCFTIIPAVWIGVIAGLVISGEMPLDDLEGGDGVGAYEERLEEDLQAGKDEGGEASLEIEDGAGDDTDAKTDADATAAQQKAAEGKDEAQEEGEIGFAHLWFLWVLLWQVAGFAVVATLVGRLARKRGGERPVSAKTAGRVMWALPLLSVLPQLVMVEGGFGPDTTEALLPAPQVLAYYACFFGFGALAYDHRARGGAELMGVIGRRWGAQLAVAVVVLFPVGLVLLEGWWTVSALLQVAFAWTMTFGLIGLFRRFLSRADFRVRYLSDASYWMYLAHLPLVFVAQGIVALLPLPALVDFVVMCVAVTALLLVSYRYVVRYTFIGRLLNGRRSRAADQASRAALTASP